MCGISGFATFLDEQVVKDIVQWQVVDIGCYEYFDGTLDLPMKTDTTNVKRKRDAVQLNGNCSDHMTGLAAASFGLFAKITADFIE